MRTEAQRQASRINGAKSKGPTSPEGKDVAKFNGLKHGLRAEQVVLPSEDPAEYEAERQGWIDDWRPKSHTAAVLCERAAQASWRLRRAVAAEAARLAERADDAGRGFDNEQFARVDRAVDRFDHDPLAALSLLQSHAAGVDRLIAAWSGLARALADGPAGWCTAEIHLRLAALLGHRPGLEPITADPTVLASARLLKANNPAAAVEARAASVDPLPEAEAQAVVEELRRRIEAALIDLHARRAEVPDPARLRDRAVTAAMADTSKEGQLRHRYEMAHERSLRGAIGQLMALAKSGTDLAQDDEVEPEPVPSQEIVADALDEAEASDAAPRHDAPGSLGAAVLVPISSPRVAPSRGSKPPRRAFARTGGAARRP